MKKLFINSEIIQFLQVLLPYKNQNCITVCRAYGSGSKVAAPIAKNN